MAKQKTGGKSRAGRLRHLALDLPDCRCVGHGHTWNKGVPMSEEAKAKSSVAHKAAMLGNTNGFKRDVDPWNKGLPGLAGEVNPFYGKKHSPEARIKMSAKAQGRVPWNKGLKGAQAGWSKGLTKETDPRVAKFAQTRNERLARGEINFGARNNPSLIAWKAYDLLLKDFEVVIPEEHFGPYSVDFLLAEEWLAIEIDGTYWHDANQTDYEKRDLYLLQEHGLPTVRLTEDEVNSWQ